jgi:hypothetical protein
MTQIPREPLLVVQASGTPILVVILGHRDLDVLAPDADSGLASGAEWPAA